MFFFFQAEDGIRDWSVTGVQTCALPIWMKTDKAVIADLPDKTEIKALCGLSRRQAALYGQAIEDLAKSLEASAGIQRKGIVLAMLMRLKQICNHPSQWLNDNIWAEEDSGKLVRPS